jgi:uncharacterized integral membrane protein
VKVSSSITASLLLIVLFFFSVTISSSSNTSSSASNFFLPLNTSFLGSALGVSLTAVLEEVASLLTSSSSITAVVLVFLALSLAVVFLKADSVGSLLSTSNTTIRLELWKDAVSS